MYGISLIFLLSAFLPESLAKTAIQIPNNKLKPDQLSCLSGLGHTGFVGPVWDRTKYDLDGMANIKNARAYGFERTYGIFLTCIIGRDEPCAAAQNQMEAAVTKMITLDVKPDILFIYINRDEWSKTDKKTNRNNLQDQIDMAGQLGQKVGIGAEKETFETVFGEDYTEQSKHPLWWIAENGNGDFNNFVQFNGWTWPDLHEFMDVDLKDCGKIYDASLNFYT